MRTSTPPCSPARPTLAPGRGLERGALGGRDPGRPFERQQARVPREGAPREAVEARAIRGGVNLKEGPDGLDVLDALAHLVRDGPRDVVHAPLEFRPQPFLLPAPDQAEQGDGED